MKRIFPIFLIVQLAAGQADFWDLAPFYYSDTPATDRVADLAGKLKRGEIAIERGTPLEKLELVLRELEVPQSSQILVFSKTSKQTRLIAPPNPRSLYFSDNAYVAYVPGGMIEVVAQDPVLGPVFYVIDPGDSAGFEVRRETSDCFSCHGTSRTENVPGLLIRSVFPDADGHLLLELGSTNVSHSTPIPDRWGGFYVTGESALPHLGNRTFVDEESIEAEIQSVEDLSDRIDTGKYLRATSDVVALVVIEHQCRMHNLLTEASMRYRRARFLSNLLNPEADPKGGEGDPMVDRLAEDIVDELLFKDEADLGDGLEGDDKFQGEFEAAHPRTESGDSLADFRLYRHIFKNRCSYMVYSEAFKGLPSQVQSAVIKRLRRALLENDTEIAPHLPISEKERIRAILEETLPEWQA